LEHGADVNVRSEGGPAPLHTTSYNWVLEVVRLLFEYGADVATEGNYGNTALQLGANRGHQEVVKLLRKHGAKLKHLAAFRTVRIQFLVRRDRTLLRFEPTKRDISRKSVYIWGMEADLGSGDSEGK
jgi:ankyrin repeat protein